jgi:hypothetical protein
MSVMNWRQMNGSSLKFFAHPPTACPLCVENKSFLASFDLLICYFVLVVCCVCISASAFAVSCNESV